VYVCSRLEKADDLAQPQPRADVHLPKRKRGGRVVRIDKAHTAAKSEIRNPKSETNSKFKFSKSSKRAGTKTSNLINSNLPRASSFVLRILRDAFDGLLKRISTQRLLPPN